MGTRALVLTNFNTFRPSTSSTPTREDCSSQCAHLDVNCAGITVIRLQASSGRYGDTIAVM